MKGRKKMEVINIEETGKNIKNIFKERNYKIKDIQDIFGFNTPQAIYKWFRGEAIPSIDNLIIISSICNIKIDDIIIRQKIG